jgi:hypothetical protein
MEVKARLLGMYNNCFNFKIAHYWVMQSLLVLFVAYLKPLEGRQNGSREFLIYNSIFPFFPF